MSTKISIQVRLQRLRDDIRRQRDALTPEQVQQALPRIRELHRLRGLTRRQREQELASFRERLLRERLLALTGSDQL